MKFILEKIKNDLTLASLRRHFYLVTPNETTFETVEEVPDYFDLAGSWWITFVGLEILVLWLQGHSEGYKINDTFTSFSAGALSQIVKLGGRIAAIPVYHYIYDNWRLTNFAPNSTLAWLLCFVSQDLLFYIGHRATHEIAILWSFHQMHHSSEYYNLSVGCRQAMFQDALLSWLDGIQAFFFPVPIIVTHRYLNFLAQFWTHTELINKLGPLEYILNTPSHHRVHHGRNPYCLDKNYGAVLIIWDRIFGTFEAERRDDPPIYGLVDNVKSFNQFYCQLFEFKLLCWDKPKSMDGFINKIKSIFYPPGWYPGAKLGWFFWFPLKDPADGVPEVEKPVVRHDMKLPAGEAAYVFCRYFFLIDTHGYRTLRQNVMTPFEHFLIICEIVAIIVGTGAVIEKKWYAKHLELCHLAGVIIVVLCTNCFDALNNPFFYIIYIPACLVHYFVFWHNYGVKKVD